MLYCGKLVLWSVTGKDGSCRGEAEVAIFSPSDAERHLLIV